MLLLSDLGYYHISGRLVLLEFFILPFGDDIMKESFQIFSPEKFLYNVRFAVWFQVMHCKHKEYRK